MPNNVLRAAFYNRKSLQGLVGVSIHQKFGNHTVASLDYRFNSKHEYLLPPENTPVSVWWGSAPANLSTFYGYINHYETVSASGGATSRMVLLGTSKSMHAVSPGSWLETTRSNIVRDIATKYRMSSIVSTHPVVMPTWATGTRSDWMVLRDLADEAGYRLWVDGSMVWFIDPLTALRTAASMTTPLIQSKDILGHLQVLGGSHIPGEVEASSRRVQYGLDRRTNEFFEATSGDTAYPTSVVPSTAVTFADAQAGADAAERIQRDQFVLKGTLRGRARIRPGSLIQVESGTVNTDQAGFWLVSAATHEITNSDFTTTIVATRGSSRQPLTRTRATARGTSAHTQAVVRDGVKWEAAIQEHVHV